MANVNFVKADLTWYLSIYALIRNCLKGSKAIKDARTTYLPQPNPDDLSPENTKRYEAYLARSIFYSIVGRTLEGLSGLVFQRDSEINVPAQLQSLLDDANGEGLGLSELIQSTFDETTALGRAGLFVDYPSTNGRAPTQIQIDTGVIRPFISLYTAENIINWHEERRGAKNELVLVVLKESYVSKLDGFEPTMATRWRVLRMGPTNTNPINGIIFNDRIYTVEIWEESNGSHQITQSFQPKANGQFFDYIPFFWVGSKNNDSKIDTPPLYDISVLNIGHYRNSAEYEDSAFWAGQPTPWVSGLTESWYRDIMQEKVHFGSRAIIPLPINSSAGILQASPNSMPKEAMDQKESQMIALGAKIIEQKNVQRTATEANLENVAENSILGTLVGNIEKAFIRALEVAVKYAGAVGPIELKINRDFGIAKLSVEERRQLAEEWVKGAITWDEYRGKLVNSGIGYEKGLQEPQKESQKELTNTQQSIN